MKHQTGITENSLEVLESRVAPAGVVTITLQGGILTLNGDAEDNRFAVSAAPNGQVLIDPLDDDTDVGAGPGVTRGLTGPVRSIVSDLGDGADNLSISGFRTLTRVDVTGGIGNDVLALVDVTVSGRVDAILGEGNDTLNIAGSNVRLGGNVVIDGGEGDNTFNFGADRAAIIGTLIVAGDSGADTFATVGSGDLRLSKNATIDLGQGNNEVLIGENTSLVALASLSIITGDGNDNVTIAEGGTLQVRTDLTIRLRDGTNTITQDESASLVVGRDFRAFGGDDQDFFNVGGADFSGRDVTLTLGNGPNLASLSGASATARNLAITGGVVDDIFEISTANLTVNGRLNISGSEGDNTTTFFSQNLLVKGAATFRGGNGVDDLQITGDGRFSGAVLVDFGIGGTEADPQRINIRGEGSGFVFANSFTVTSTGGLDSADTLFLQSAEMRGRVNISMGEGVSTAELNDVYLRNTLRLETNGGNDSISIERSDFSPFDSLAQRTVTLLPGLGDDTVLIGTGVAGSRVDFRGRLVVNDEGGTDTINDVANANLFRPNIPPEITGFENIVT